MEKKKYYWLISIEYIVKEGIKSIARFIIKKSIHILVEV